MFVFLRAILKRLEENRAQSLAKQLQGANDSSRRQEAWENRHTSFHACVAFVCCLRVLQHHEGGPPFHNFYARFLHPLKHAFKEEKGVKVEKKKKKKLASILYKPNVGLRDLKSWQHASGHNMTSSVRAGAMTAEHRVAHH